MLGPLPFQVGRLWMCFNPVQKQAELQLNLDKFCLVSSSLCVCCLQTNWAYTARYSLSQLENLINLIKFGILLYFWSILHGTIVMFLLIKNKFSSQHSACVFNVSICYSVCSSFLTSVFLLLLSPCLMNQTPTVQPTVRRLSFTRRTSGSTRSACLPS